MPYPEPIIEIRRRSLAVLDDKTGTWILLFFDPFLRRWRAYLTWHDGRFRAEVTSINVCGCAVAEYCARSHPSGNVYIDVCYCEGIDMHDINMKFMLPWEVIAAYHAGQTETYYKRIREILPKMRDYLIRQIKKKWEDVEDALWDVFRGIKGLEEIVDIEYDGFFVTVVHYCPGVYYGSFCRMERRGCSKTDCKSLCDAGLVECDPEKIKECIKTKKIAL